MTGPFGDKIKVSYAVKDDLAVFEMAEIVGLASIPHERRSPLFIKTQGVGELIVELVQNGVKRIVIGVGGSASHDGWCMRAPSMSCSLSPIITACFGNASN
ncbi:glycerate kinase [Rothia nasimurium]|uniref:glycerate kinase n=1 Tax=Rothia nasimurium TaxID=85336 RepID=UPI0034DEA9F8